MNTAAHQPWMDSQWFARWLALARHVAVLCACVWGVAAREYYVSPTGKATSDGSTCRPWSLRYALTNAVVTGGDTIWLRGGTYSGAFQSLISSSVAASPIVIRKYGSERPIISGSTTSAGITLSGSNVWLIGLEFTDPATQRTSQRQNGIAINASGCRAINCVVHDCGTGILANVDSTNSLVYGCVVFNNGWQSVSRGSGHAFYVQGNQSAYRTVLRDNMACNQFGWGLHFYGQSANVIGIEAHRNTVWNSGILSTEQSNPNIEVTGSSVIQDIVVSSNLFYHAISDRNEAFGKTTTTFGSLVVGSNYFATGYAFFGPFTNLTVRGNRFEQGRASLYYDTSKAFPSYNWGGNVYRWNLTSTPVITNLVNIDWVDWQALGLDTDSTFSNTAPSSTDVFVTRNEFESGRGNVTVYNWTLADNVNVDLSSVLTVGKKYEVRNAENWTGAAVKSGTYAGGSISLPMTNLTVAVPVGLSAPASTGPGFAAFVVLPK